MCGIIGLFNAKDVKKRIDAGLKLIKYRGKDSSNTFVKGKNGIGHNLHAIINHIPQPLENKFISNCEIYNWKELKEKNNLKTNNDSETIFKLIEKKGINIIEEFDGVFALAYWDNNKVYLVRDIIGIKPIWFSKEEEFGFCSEKKVLENLGFKKIEELNPRKILVYDIEKNEIEFINRKFFSLKPELKIKKKIKEELKIKLINAIKKRIPNKKVGLLFSGGIDSTVIAFLLKELKVDFTCYIGVLDEKTMSKSEDLIYAERIAKEWDLKLKVVKIPVKEIDKHLKTIVPLIEDSNVVKVGVALPFYLACQKAKKDDIKVIFSGLGSEEIFAGYERHELSSNLNEECLYGLQQLYHRDLYRDDVITMYNNIELRLPFLDLDLVKYALRIPQKLKYKDGVKKLILREVCYDLGIKKDYSFRRKKAAQYGSKFDKGLGKIAKKEGMKKSEYLRRFKKDDNLRLGGLFSSGKDSTYAIYVMKKMNYDIKCLITIKSKNPHSYMFHTPNIDLVDLQSEALDIPLIKFETEGKKEEELKDLRKAIEQAKSKFSLDGIITGALFSTYQRNRIERICDNLGLKVFSPLWHKDQEEEMREIVKEKFEIIFSSIAAYGLDKTWLNKIITDKEIDELIKKKDKIGVNIAGEGGEFESLVLDCPLFKKKIKIIKSKIIMEDENTGNLIVEKAKLIEKK